MKFDKKHYQTLKESIKTALTGKDIKQLSDQYHNEGKSIERFVWDIFWLSKWTTNYKEQYYNGDYADAHIFTATKKAMDEIYKNI